MQKFTLNSIAHIMRQIREDKKYIFSINGDELLDRDVFGYVYGKIAKHGIEDIELVCALSGRNVFLGGGKTEEEITDEIKTEIESAIEMEFGIVVVL